MKIIILSLMCTFAINTAVQYMPYHRSVINPDPQTYSQDTFSMFIQFCRQAQPETLVCTAKAALYKQNQRTIKLVRSQLLKMKTNDLVHLFSNKTIVPVKIDQVLPWLMSDDGFVIREESIPEFINCMEIVAQLYGKAFTVLENEIIETITEVVSADKPRICLQKYLETYGNAKSNVHQSNVFRKTQIEGYLRNINMKIRDYFEILDRFEKCKLITNSSNNARKIMLLPPQAITFQLSVDSLFEIFPDKIAKLEELDICFFADDNDHPLLLERLPDTLFENTSLKKLSLSVTAFRFKPGIHGCLSGVDFAKLKFIRELDLKGVPIDSDLRPFSELIHLEKLSIETSTFVDSKKGILPDSEKHIFFGPKSLIELKIINCASIPSVEKLEALQKFDVSNNMLESISDGKMWDMAHVKELNLSNNDFSGALPFELSKVEVLDFSGNESLVAIDSIHKAEYLKSLNLQFCGLTEVSFFSWKRSMKNLEELDVSNNSIRKLTGLCVKNLKVLKIENNNHSGMVFDADFFDLDKLEVLEMRDTYVDKIEEFLINLKKLKNLKSISLSNKYANDTALRRILGDQGFVMDSSGSFVVALAHA